MMVTMFFKTAAMVIKAATVLIIDCHHPQRDGHIHQQDGHTNLPHHLQQDDRVAAMLSVYQLDTVQPVSSTNIQTI